MKFKQSFSLDLSPLAYSLYINAENKSKFVEQCIEFYAHHGQWIQEDIESIKKTLEQLLSSGIPINSITENVENQEVQITKEQNLTPEQKEELEIMKSTLAAILGEDDD